MYNVLKVCIIIMSCFSRNKQCKRKHAAMDEVDAEILHQLGSMKGPEADKDSLFAQSIAASLKRMDPQKKSLAKIKIQQALFEVEFAPPYPPQPHMLPPPSTYPPFAANTISEER